jgi:hypothetical protein
MDADVEAGDEGDIEGVKRKLLWMRRIEPFLNQLQQSRSNCQPDLAKLA